MAEAPTQTYYAKSALTDPQNILSYAEAALGVLALPEVAALIPLKWMPVILAISGAIHFLARTFLGVRPVAFIAPTSVKPVEVQRLNPTQTGSET